MKKAVTAEVRAEDKGQTSNESICDFLASMWSTTSLMRNIQMQATSRAQVMAAPKASNSLIGKKKAVCGFLVFVGMTSEFCDRGS